ncbi:hypothetical protein [Tsukamurella tyrosinosolvens]|uniref:hypothetical protein n=1 Tax=Tsukamurella tyrosinosolvens TaxID=57704 RepID=UPI000E15BE08|nr:hypothetical protein [Tsukamurella tyrosinosolvens]RDB49103.1 hypothetical protein DVB87_04805 [Tsukamurella tyrosinosolvens]
MQVRVMSTGRTNTPTIKPTFDATREYGPLLFRAENPTGGVRTVRLAVLVVVAAALITAAMSSVLALAEPGGPPPPWWVCALGLPGWLLALWSVFELLGLMSSWRHVGWTVDVYERGVVESRFGEVRQAMPYAGGVIDPRRGLFFSPHPHVGDGLLTAPWKGELRDAPSEIRVAAQPVLVREILSELRAGKDVTFPGRRAGKPGIRLFPDRLTLPNGCEYEHASSRVQYWSVTGGGDAVTRALTDDLGRANTIVFLTDDEANGFRANGGFGIPGLERTSPNLAVVRETLHILLDPDGHWAMYRAQLDAQQQEQS